MFQNVLLCNKLSNSADLLDAGNSWWLLELYLGACQIASTR